MRGLALAALAAAVIVTAARWGSFVAGGPDSYCYVNQAQRWSAVLTGQGDLQVAEPLAIEAPWPNASLTFAPVGHTASPTVAGAAVPICPAGLSLAMAPFVAVGGPRAAFAVVPLFGVLLVLATFAVGSRYGARIGMAAALLTASSPVFLYQVVQPMSDVPAAALWMLAVACATGTRPRSVLWSGLLTSAAFLVRPRSEEHTSELQSQSNLVCRLLLDSPAPETSTLSLHDALPIYRDGRGAADGVQSRLPLPGRPADERRPGRGLVDARGRVCDRHPPQVGVVERPADQRGDPRAAEIGRAHV